MATVSALSWNMGSRAVGQMGRTSGGWHGKRPKICSLVRQHCHLGPALHCVARDILPRYGLSVK